MKRNIVLTVITMASSLLIGIMLTLLFPTQVRNVITYPMEKVFTYVYKPMPTNAPVGESKPAPKFMAQASCPYVASDGRTVTVDYYVWGNETLTAYCTQPDGTQTQALAITYGFNNYVVGPSLNPDTMSLNCKVWKGDNSVRCVQANYQDEGVTIGEITLNPGRPAQTNMLWTHSDLQVEYSTTIDCKVIVGDSCQ